MSIKTEVDRLKTAKTDIAESVGRKGVEIPPSETLSNYAPYIDQIKTGGDIYLESIKILKEPDKTSYLPGERFDPAGMIVEATYSNGAKMQASGYSWKPDGDLVEGTTEVEIFYSEGGKTASVKQTISVERKVIYVPSQSGSLTYNGSAQSPSWSNYDSSKMVLSGATKGTDAGSYTAIFTPNMQYKWPDGGTGPRNVNWSISRASGKVTLSPSSVTLDPDHKSATVSISRLGDGAISVSGGGGIVRPSVSGTTLTIASIGDQSGDTSVTVSVAQSTNYTAASASVTVKAEFIPSLQDATWEQIRQASDNGMASTYWKVGDTKTITINGSVGNTNFSNLSIDAVIIGFDHNASIEGRNRIHFLIGMKDRKLAGLYDNNYTADNGWTPGGAGDMVMNTSKTNAGGWGSSYMRKTILGGDRNPNSPLPNSLLAALPPDLRAVMKPVKKYTDNTGNMSDTSGAVTATTDYLFLLAEHELFGGDRHYANQYEKNSQTQYAYFVAGNSKYVYKYDHYDSTGGWVYWWLRSPYYNTSDYFCSVYINGKPDNTVANYSFAVLAGFAV